MCKYSDRTGYKCPHKILEDSDYCIFHLQDGNKDVDEFNKGIKEILESEEDSINFNGFYFPPESSDFSAQIFQNEMNFCGAVFSGYANFYMAEFKGCAHFEYTTFSKIANFIDTTFMENANFESATFSKLANSINAEFLERADMGGVKLSEANFAGAIFLKSAYFMYATFSERVDFGKTNFGKTNFGKIKPGDTEFQGTADFSETTFVGDVNFEDTIFIGDAIFIRTTFIGKTNFRKTNFSKSVHFYDAEFAGKFRFIPGKCGIISFEHTHFSDNVRIKADLSECSFVSSNIERVDMTYSIWIEDNKPKNLHSSLIEWFKYKMRISGNSIKIWEEYREDHPLGWIELEGIYRRLKQSCQKFGDNSIAGKFYYQEMECKRKQSKGFKNLCDWAYKVSCGYGERPWNVFWISISAILISSLLFFYWGIELIGSKVLNLTPRLINYDLNGNLQWTITNIDVVFNDWLECLYTSVITFTTLGYGDVHPIGLSRIVASVEAGIGIIMTALFIFVFTRKMLR